MEISDTVGFCDRFSCSRPCSLTSHGGEHTQSGGLGSPALLVILQKLQFIIGVRPFHNVHQAKCGAEHLPAFLQDVCRVFQTCPRGKAPIVFSLEGLGYNRGVCGPTCPQLVSCHTTFRGPTDPHASRIGLLPSGHPD